MWWSASPERDLASNERLCRRPTRVVGVGHFSPLWRWAIVGCPAAFFSSTSARVGRGCDSHLRPLARKGEGELFGSAFSKFESYRAVNKGLDCFGAAYHTFDNANEFATLCTRVPTFSGRF